MCFVKICSNPDEIKNARRIAEQDIHCYKVVQTVEKISLGYGANTKIVSQVMDFEYEYNVKYPEVKLTPTLKEGVPIIFGYRHTTLEINEGYHSYITLDTAEEIFRSIMWRFPRTYSTLSFYATDNCIIVECIIPKGSEYYYNEDEYVSSSIIIVRQISPKTTKF